MYFFCKNIIGPALARQAFPCSHVLGHSEKCRRLYLSPQSIGLQEATAGSDHPKRSLGGPIEPAGNRQTRPCRTPKSGATQRDTLRVVRVPQWPQPCPSHTSPGPALPLRQLWSKPMLYSHLKDKLVLHKDCFHLVGKRQE